MLKSLSKSCGCQNGAKKIDLVGKKFNAWTVLKEVDYKISSKGSVQRYWLCRCFSGKEREVFHGSLTTYKSKSCGCLTKHAWNRLNYGEASFNLLYNSYKKRAKKRELSFTLSKDIFIKLVKQDCFYCGTTPSQVIRCSQYYGEFTYNGLDRVDNVQGYLEDNVRPCCKVCNSFKLDMNCDSFYKHVKKVYRHLKGKKLLWQLN